MDDAFERARDSEAIALYNANVRKAHPDPRAVLTRARIALRTAGQAPKALPLLKAIAPATNGSDLVWQQMLLGEAYASAGDYAIADDRLQRALQAATQKGDSELIAAVGYRIGERYVLESNVQRAREGLALAKTGRSTESKLAAQLLESRVLEAESRIHDRVRVLIKLLSSIDPGSERYMPYRIAGTYALAVCARETYAPEAIRVVERQLGGRPWPQDYASRRFLTERALAWTSALAGNYFDAFRHFRERIDAAPTDAWRTLAHCDLAYMAGVRNERNWCEQELHAAQVLANTADWESRDDESIFTLVFLAELSAVSNPTLARKYLRRFGRIIDTPKRLKFFYRERRFQALVDYASAVVDLHDGERKHAVDGLESARGTYRDIGFEWRAARCDLRLFDATRKTAYLQEAHRWLTHFQNSWLADEWRARLSGSKRESGLTPMRDRTFRLLCEGKSNIEIADELDLSVATVANHAKAVLKFFQVSSRHALLAEARRRKLI